MTPDDLRNLESADEKLIDEVKHLREELKYLRGRVDDSLAKATQAIHEIEKHRSDLEQCSVKKGEQLDLILSGFPNRDPVGHSVFHARLIKKAEEEEAMIKDAKRKVFAGVALSGLTFVGVAVWEYIKNMVHK